MSSDNTAHGPSDAMRVYLDAAAGMLEELSGLGIEVAGANRLRLLSTATYRRAVPVLIRWFPLVSLDRVRLDIVHTLANRKVVPLEVGCVLVAWFQEPVRPTDGPGLRWAIGSGIRELASPAIADDMVRLASEERWGRDRSEIVLGLARIVEQRPDVVELLIALTADPDVLVATEAIATLGALHVARAREVIAPLVEHPESWHRQQRRRAIAKLDRAMAKQSAS